MEQGSAAGTGCQAEAAAAGTTLRMETAHRAGGTGSALPFLPIFCATFPIRDVGTAHSLAFPPEGASQICSWFKLPSDYSTLPYSL